MKKRYSKKRDAILELIRSTEIHPSAQWIYEELKPKIPDLSLGTVYRNISSFLREGSVASVGVINGEERFDGRIEPHAHCVCIRCGKVHDLPPLDIEALSALIPEKAGFSLDLRKTVFYGLCPNCRVSLSTLRP